MISEPVDYSTLAVTVCLTVAAVCSIAVADCLTADLAVLVDLDFKDNEKVGKYL